MKDLPGDDRIRLWHAILDVQAAGVEQLGGHFRSTHGLTVSEFDVLINIGPREALRHGELAHRVVLSRSALTRLIARLQDRGLLTATPSPDDSRGVLIALTDTGRDLRRAASRDNNRIVRHLLRPLTDADIAAALSALTALPTPRRTPTLDSNL